MDSLTFLERAAKATLHPVFAVCGDEDFLKRQVLGVLRRLVLGEQDDGFAYSSYTGDKLEFASIRDELETPPFLGPRRLVVVERADPFVSAYRTPLERYVEKPSACSVLVLEVTSWTATTRLAKQIPDAATLVCKAPAAFKLAEWCVQWAQTRHGKPLGAQAARMLVDLVGNEMGLLDQELGKLAASVAPTARIEPADVDLLIGQSRGENTWKIFDLIGHGKVGDALELLGKLLDQGEDPIKLLGAFSLQLRRLAQAARLCVQGAPLDLALEQASIPPFARREAEQSLRHLGRRRADRLFDWLLEVDLGLKGSSMLPPRTQLERLVIHLARGRG